MLNYMEKMEKDSLLMAIDSNYIMKKKIIMTKGKQSLPSFLKNELQKQDYPPPYNSIPGNLEALELVLDHHLLDRSLINHMLLILQVPVLASTPFSAKLLKYLSEEVKVERRSSVPSLSYHGSLEDIPSSNQTKIEYLYTLEIKMQVKDKVSSSKCKYFATFTKGLGATVIIGLVVLTVDAVLEELCLAVLIGTRPDLFKTVVGAKFLLEL
ncbi:hypothetical protein Tco_0531713 [Tanacetum coccineum]